MTQPQIIIVSIFVIMIAAFVWGRVRYDLVAALALLAGLAAGVVPNETAFKGFADDIVIIIASALITSKAISKSGVIDLLVRRSAAFLSTPRRQVAALAGAVMVLSAFIKNIGALSMAIPASQQFTERSGTPASRLLMPMAFASLLGGIVTLVGTSPNLIVSRVRQDIMGEGYGMFDFAFVGLPLAISGLLLIVLAYRLVPVRQRADVGDTAPPQVYTVEAVVPKSSEISGQPARALAEASGGRVSVLAIVRKEHSRITKPVEQLLRPEDHVLLQGEPNDIDALIREEGLSLRKGDDRLSGKVEPDDDIETFEAVVTGESLLTGWTPAQLRLADRFSAEVIGVQRRGEQVAVRLKGFRFMVGDVIVLRAGRSRRRDLMSELGLLPLASAGISLGQRRNWVIPVAILAVAMALMALQLVSVPVAFFGAAVLVVASGSLTLQDAYHALDAPVLVTLACLIPLSEALRTAGVTDLISTWLSNHAASLPPSGALVLIMVIAMLVTPFLNNAATVLVTAPIAASFAQNLGYSPDPFLMAVALGAASDFLTPVGHQCNMLVYGAGGYRFTDYMRLGLPLSILVVAMGVPAILWFWPL